MSLPSSPVPVAVSSAENCSVGKRSAPSKSTPTVNGFLCSDRMMEAFLFFQSGRTSEPLTAVRGLALSMSSVADSPAKTSAPPETVPESLESEADCGPRWHASFARWNPATSSWKTAQCSLLGGLTEFSETWPSYGMMRDGECSVLPELEHLTCESESGLWQTPVADDAVERTDGKWNSRGEPKLSAQVKLWPTPRASDGSKGGRVTPRKSREGGTLIEAVSARTMWATPTVCGNYNKKGSSAKSGDGLATQAGGQLNPRWVEWLQGWPIGWTNLAPLEMAKFQEWLNAHGRR